MSDQVLRMEARSNPIASTSHLLQHILGEIRPRNAVARPGLPAVSVLVNEVDAARAAMDAELAKPRRGARPCPALDFIFAGPPPHDSPYAWKRAGVDAWAEATLDWVRAYCPDAPVAAAAVHWDERSPHMHLLLAPIVREGAKVRLGIKAIRKRLASGVQAPQRKRGQHRDELSAVQDAYHKHVAAQFGLNRGNTQSTARHVKVDALEGAQRRLNDLKGSVEHYDRAMDTVLEQHRDLNTTVAELRYEQTRLKSSREVDEREAHLAHLRRETAEKEAREAEEKRKREGRLLPAPRRRPPHAPGQGAARGIGTEGRGARGGARGGAHAGRKPADQGERAGSACSEGRGAQRRSGRRERDDARARGAAHAQYRARGAPRRHRGERDEAARAGSDGRDAQADPQTG